MAVSRQRVREILSQSRDLMNDSGAHWIKSRLTRKRKNGERAYCSIGSIFAVTDDVEEREEAIKALAQKGLNKGLEYPYKFRYKRNNFSGRIVVEGWNDSPGTKWENVDKAFRKAIRALR